MFARKQKSEWRVSSHWSWVAAGLVGLLGLTLFDSTEWASVGATFALGSLAGAISVSLGCGLAWCLYRAGPRPILLSGLVFAAMLPIYWHLAAWDSLFGRLGLWAAFGSSPLQLALPRWTAAIWVHGVAGIAPAAALLLAYLINAGRVVDEQALVETTAGGVFWRVTLPRLWPAIGLVFGWSFLTTSREIAVTDIYRIGTVAEQVYLGFALGQFDQLLSLWPAGEQALSLRLYILTVVLLAILAGWWVAGLSRWEWSGEAWQGWRRQGDRRTVPLVGASLILAGVLLVPLISLSLRAGLRVRTSAEGIQPVWSSEALSESLLRGWQQSQTEFGWSLAISLTAAALLWSAGIVGTRWAERSRCGRLVFFGSIVLLLGMPGPVCGLMVARGWDLLGFPWAWWAADRTILLPVLASCLFCWPLAGVGVFLLLRMTPAEWEEAAATQGVSSGQAFRAVRLAGTWRLLVGLAAALAVVVFGDLSAQQMVAVPGIDTIPRQLLGWMHAGVDELAAATSLLIALLLGGVGLVCSQLLGRRR